MSFGIPLRNGISVALGNVATLSSGGRQPSLALNFLGVNTLDSRITFTRASTGTYFNSSGVLATASNDVPRFDYNVSQATTENLLTYSQAIDNAAWTKSNSFVQTNLLTYSEQFDNAIWLKTTASVTANTVIAPDGSLTADTITATTTSVNNGFLAQAVSMTASTTYTYSAYVKHGTESSVQLQAICTVGGVNSGCFATFNLVSGTASAATNYGSVTGATASITPAANGFYRCVLIVPIPAGVITAGATWFFPFSGSDVAGTYAYLFGAQLVQGSVPGDYQATTSAALPVLYRAPDGTLTAEKLCENNVSNYHAIFQAITPATTAGSFYVKAAEQTFVQIAGGVSVNDYVTFNLSTGVIAQQGSGITNAFITPLSNGWYRIGGTCTSSASGPFLVCCQNGTSGFRPVYTGDGSSGIYVWGAQLNTGSTALAYTATTANAVSIVPLAQNLVLYSNDWSQAQWNKPNITLTAAAALGPDNTFSMSKLEVATSTFTNCNQQVTATSTSHTYSIYAKKGSAATDSNLFAVYNSTTATTLAQLSINYDTGVITQTTGTGATATAVGNNIWRIVIPVTSGITVGNVLNCYSCYLGGTDTAGKYAYVYGAQLNIGATALPYLQTTSAAISQYQPKGLLIEESRTNLLLQSNDFQTSWTNTNVTRTLNAAGITSPDGGTNAVKLEATTAAAATSTQAAVVAATAATYSVFVKQGTGATIANNFVLRNVTTLTNLLHVTLNYSTGAVTYVTGSTGVTATFVGNGWWRLVMTATAGITAGDSVGVYPGWIGSLGGTPAAGDFLYAYGAQLEAGAFATSYVATTTSQLTRAADVATISAGSWYNANNGTWYFNGETQRYPRYIIVDNSGAAKYPMYVHTAAGGIGNFDGTNLTLTSNTTTTQVTFKAATSYTGSAATATLNAGTVATGTYNGAFSTIATFRLFGATGPGGEINGHARSLAFYPRALSAAEQQSITV